MKFNTDGVSKGNPGLAGAGGLIRKDTSRFVKSFFFKYGICFYVRVELMAVFRGFLMVKDLIILRLIL